LSVLGALSCGGWAGERGVGADVDGEYGGERDECVGREEGLDLRKLVGQATHQLGRRAGIRHYGG